jgi:dipeptidyl aminopeptidase/acylaminoacyl peptidase
MRIANRAAMLAVAVVLAVPWLTQAQPGIFEGSGDIGTVLHKGSVEYDANAKSYKVTGSGENVWGISDGFFFVWKKISGDVSLSADISFATKTGEEHKKAMLMFRQSLDADSAYADIAAHLVGLTSLQSRESKGTATHEVQANVGAIPKHLQITKRGSYFYMSVGDDGEAPHFAGPAMKVELQEPFYVGIGVGSHNKENLETATFSNVTITSLPPSTARGTLYSTMETITVSSTDRRVAYSATGRFEAPNWLADNTLIYNAGGHLLRIPSDRSAKPAPIDTGAIGRINNDHVPTPDGSMVGISDQTQPGGSRIYLVPIAGGTPRKITEKAPSYLHGISPDGKTLAYCAQRNGNFDVYTIPAAGGEETRLTTADGLDDGPEYSPDGQYIYFNSVRSGSMQIWRMKPDGSGQEQVTPNDDYNNWFAHVSPDGSRIAFVSFTKDVPADQHPPDKEVMLRVMTLANKRITVLTKLFGGQGTMNVNSWSPDSRRLAFVSYQYIQ